MKKVLIIIIVIVVLGGGAGAYFLFFANKPKEEPEPVLCNYAIEDSFITNVKDSERLCKSSIILVVNKEKMDEYLKSNIYSIRDTILIILRNLTEEDIASMNILDKLRTEIPTALNEKLGIDNIVSIYFGDFVMQ